MPTNDLAGSNLNAGSIAPEQLFAGDRPVTTDHEMVAAGQNLAKYQVVGRGAGGLMAADPNAGPVVADRPASGMLSFGGNPLPDNTLTINGHVITFKAAGAVGQQVNIGETPDVTAANVETYVNATPATGVTANDSGAGAQVALTAIAAGVAGNAITLAKSGGFPTLSGATMSGGADDVETSVSGCIGIMAQPVNATAGAVSGPYYTGGFFNHEMLVWPASLSTLAARKAAFDGTSISIGTLG